MPTTIVKALGGKKERKNTFWTNSLPYTGTVIGIFPLWLIINLSRTYELTEQGSSFIKNCNIVLNYIVVIIFGFIMYFFCDFCNFLQVSFVSDVIQRHEKKKPLKVSLKGGGECHEHTISMSTLTRQDHCETSHL